jgi:2-(1,2-epoxy-1,2-dihydrophenyl)acetyl-CoA isomerase
MPVTDPTDSAAPVLVHQADAVRTITLNRPQALNSLDAALHAALLQALDDAANDRAVRCVVLTGAGRAFCAGQDLADPAVAPDSAAIDRLIDERYRPLALRLHTFPTPVVAAVNGVAAGAGANLALNCDIVVAARSASFIQAFAKIGLIPDCGGTWLLPRLVGRGRAMGLAMLADKLPAEQALAMGLIWQVVDDAGLGEAARALASRLAAMPTDALVRTREALDAAAGMTLAQALSLEAQVQGVLGRSADYREGVQAFFERRAPRFASR